MVEIIPFHQPSKTPERPNFRRLMESVLIKQLQPDARLFIEAEFIRYEQALRAGETEVSLLSAKLADRDEKLRNIRAGLAELTDWSL